MMTARDIRIFCALLSRYMIVTRKKFFDTLINSLVWTGSYIIVGSYILPELGMSDDYGTFLLPGALVTTAFFEASNLAREVLADMEGNRSIVFDFTLPLSAFWVYTAKAVSYALQLAALTILVVPFGKILLLKKFSLSAFSVLGFAALFIVTNLFCGFFVLWMAGKVEELVLYRNVWARYGHPLWIFGCFQFSWLVIYQALPMLAYINLFNPLVYLVEGMRAAILGQQGFINMWICCAMSLFFILFCAWYGFRLMKKRLDFV